MDVSSSRWSSAQPPWHIAMPPGGGIHSIGFPGGSFAWVTLPRLALVASQAGSTTVRPTRRAHRTLPTSTPAYRSRWTGPTAAGAPTAPASRGPHGRTAPRSADATHASRPPPRLITHGITPPPHREGVFQQPAKCVGGRVSSHPAAPGRLARSGAAQVASHTPERRHRTSAIV